MDIRQLATLVAVADHKTFSAAAVALHTVQSNVSTHVARLEKELGVTLVDRARSLLTEEGRAVVDRARRIQAEMEALVADVAAVNRQIEANEHVGDKIAADLEVRIGQPAGQIIAAAKESKCDAIVMSTRGLTGLDRYLIGSVADRVARLAPCPVVLVRPGKRSPEPRQKRAVVLRFRHDPKKTTNER